VKPEVSWVDATNLVERLRAIKDPKDIEYMWTAAELSRAGVIALVEAIAPGMDPYHRNRHGGDGPIVS
jgi:Xaa-Pro aminopeptidase